MRAALAAVVLVLAAPAVAAADPALQPLAGSFDQPVHVNGPDGDAARVFVVEKTGRVQLVVDGARQATPFLDVSAITEADPATERGLLSIAFAPDYATSGLFYVFLTGKAGAIPGSALGDVIVFEGRRSAADPNRADPAPLRPLFSITHPATNHNGGQLAFGPDGLLYASVGDGASGANAQDAGSRLGKLLRLDPRAAGATPSVWALGLRNPWRFSFDRITGDVLIGDVGEGTKEEIDRVPAGTAPGSNLGWPACEGDVTLSAGGCATPGFTPPVLVLSHGDGYSAVIGGFVVRDPGLPSLLGRYVFGDLSKGTLFSAALGTDTVPRPELALGSTPRSLGEDGCGHVHVALGSNTVARLQDGALGPCVLPFPPAAVPPPTGGGGPAADRVKPGLVAARAAKRLRRGRLRIALTADEAATATLRARRFRTRTVTLTAGRQRIVRLRATRPGLRKLRRALRRGGGPRSGSASP